MHPSETLISSSLLRILTHSPQREKRARERWMLEKDVVTDGKVWSTDGGVGPPDLACMARHEYEGLRSDLPRIL